MHTEYKPRRPGYTPAILGLYWHCAGIPGFLAEKKVFFAIAFLPVLCDTFSVGITCRNGEKNE